MKKIIISVRNTYTAEKKKEMKATAALKRAFLMFAVTLIGDEKVTALFKYDPAGSWTMTQLYNVMLGMNADRNIRSGMKTKPNADTTGLCVDTINEREKRIAREKKKGS